MGHSKIFLLILLPFFLGRGTVAQNSVYSPDTTWNKLDIKNRKIGKWKKQYPNGNLRYVGNFVIDEPLGNFTYYFESGNLQAKLAYHKSGHTKMITFYDSRDTSVFLVGGYYKKLLHGKQFYFYPNGKKRADESYYKGIKHGDFTYFSTQGQIILKERYRNGALVGKRETFYPNGKPFRMITFRQGKETGKAIGFAPNGDTLFLGNYQKGIKNGAWHFFKKGKKNLSLHFKNGKAKEDRPIMITLNSNDENTSFSIVGIPNFLDIMDILQKIDSSDKISFDFNFKYLDKKNINYKGITVQNTDKISILPQNIFIFKSIVRIIELDGTVQYFFDEKKELEMFFMTQLSKSYKLPQYFQELIKQNAIQSKTNIGGNEWRGR